MNTINTKSKIHLNGDNLDNLICIKLYLAAGNTVHIDIDMVHDLWKTKN